MIKKYRFDWRVLPLRNLIRLEVKNKMVLRFFSFCFLTLVFAVLTHQKAGAQGSTLQAGDLIFVGYNADDVSGTNDDFSFILLRDIEANTTIHFTDFGWCSGAGYTGFQRANPCPPTQSQPNSGSTSDGAITWKSASALTCGTQVRILCKNNLSASTGTVVGLQNTSTIPADYISLSPGGDQLFAFQGSLAEPALIAGIDMNGGWVSSLGLCDFIAGTSTLPAALGATHTFSLTTEVDNAVYNCSTTGSSKAELIAAIKNQSNWNVDNTTPFTLPLSCTFACSVLPVKLVSFKGAVMEKSNLLTWAVTDAVNFSHFQVEMSPDGKKFEFAGSVRFTAELNSYQFVHETGSYKSPAGVTSYYRLKMVDLDSTFSYSRIISLKNEGAEQFSYPNPFTEKITVSLPSQKETTAVVKVVDTKGTVVFKRRLLLYNQQVITIENLAGLSSGTYILSVQTGKTVRKQKIIKD